MKFASRAIPMILMHAAEATESTGVETAASEQVATGEVPTSNTPGTEQAPKKRAPKNPENKLNIINGRIPYPLAYLIRFKETGATADVAKRYGTSIGKVFDLKKSKNFSYIDAGYVPSADEMQSARNWLTEAKTAKGQSLKEAGGDPDGIAKMLDEMKVATPEEVAKRNWQTRQVGQPRATGEAPTAPASSAPSTSPQAQQLEKPAGAKLF